MSGEAFSFGFWGVLGALAAILAVACILGLGYVAGLFLKAFVAVWRLRRR